MPKNTKESNEMEEQEKKIEFTDEGSVSIQYESFRKMLSHTLRFANDSKEEKQQVFGICIGEYLKDKKKFIVKDAIPLAHGDDIEIGWSQEMHDIIDKVHSKYTDSDQNIIGWYHSHLGYGLYFSNSDKVNNLTFQHMDNPYGFGIVIEQTLLNENHNFGVEVYRLNNVAKGAESDYVKVSFDIHPPNSMNFFKWIKELVESTQNKESKIIYEFEELKKPPAETLQEIPGSEKDEEKEGKKEELSLLYGVKDGIDRLPDSFLKIYEQQLSSWMDTISDDMLIGSEYIRSSINNIKTTLSSGLEDAQRIFDKIFTEISELFMKNVRTSVDTRLDGQIELKNNIEAVTEEQLKYLFERLEKEIRDVINVFEENITNIKKEFEKVTQNNKSILDAMEKNTEMLNAVYEEADKLSESISKHIDNSSKSLESNLINTLVEFSEKISPNKEIFNETEELIERLQRVISDLRQIK